jgi:MFS family permease
MSFRVFSPQFPAEPGRFGSVERMRRLLLLVAAVVFVDSMFFAALTPLLADYADRLELSKAGAGVLSGAYAAGALIAGIPGGIATARFGVKPTLIVGLAGMAVTTATFGFAEHIVVLDLARFLQGCSSALSWTAAFAWLIAAAPPQRRGELIGAGMGAAIFGALFGPVVGGVAALTSTEVAFGSVAVLAFGLGLWAWRTPSFPATGRQPLRLLFRALLDPRIVTGAWFVALPALFFGTLGVLAPLRLDDLGFGALAIGATWLVMAALEGILSPLVGRLSDRRGRLLPLRAGLLAAIPVAATIPWLTGAWPLAVFVVLSGVAFGTFWSPAMSLLADSAEARGLDHAYGFAVVNVAWAPGAAAGAAIGGSIAEAAGDAVPYLALTVACVVTALWLTRLETVQPATTATRTAGPGVPAAERR